MLTERLFPRFPAFAYVSQRDLLKFTPVFTTKQLLALEMSILKVTRVCL